MTKYRVADTPFNQHWHSDIIGQVFDEVPRPYCALEIIDGDTADVQTSIYDGEENMDEFDHRAMQDGYDKNMEPIYLEESDYDRAERYRKEAQKNVEG